MRMLYHLCLVNLLGDKPNDILMPGAYVGQERLSASLELELQIVVILHVGAGNCIQMSWQKSQCS